MRTKIVKWVSIAALLLALLFWKSAPQFQLALNVVVSAAAAVVVLQAVQAKKRRWAVLFFAIAVLFNPLVPAFPLAGTFSMSLIVFSMATFAISLNALRAQPLLSMPSITDKNPGSESL